MEMSHARQDLPGAFCLICRKDIGIAHSPLLIGSQQRIELPVVVFQRSSPLTSSVGRTL